MAKIFFHNHSKQYAICIKRKTFYLGRDKNEAKVKRLEIELDYEKNKQVLNNPNSLSFAKLADTFLDKIKRKISNETHKDYQASLNLICSLFADKKCKEINLPLINKLKDYLLDTRGISPERVNRYTGLIKRVFNWALENEVLRLEHIRLPKIKKEPHQKPPPRFLNDNEIKLLLSYRDTEPINIKHLPHNKAVNYKQDLQITIDIAKFVMSTGRRIQEVLQLRKRDFDFNANFYIVTKDKVVKTNPRPKIFHLNDTALKIIKNYADHKKDNELIFKNTNGTQITTVIIGKRFKKIIKDLALKNITFKDLRHTFASQMLIAGESIESVKEHLGHTSIKTTEIYAHLSNKHLKQSINNKNFTNLFD